MAAEQDEPLIDVEDYLRAEEQGEIKHEFIHGRVYATAGGTLGHDGVGNSVRALIYAHLRGKDCFVHGPDVRLRVSPTIYYYPDAMITCGERPTASAREVTAPVAIVEILSDSTEANERGFKFSRYQTLSTLEEYSLIDGRRRSIERFRRSGSDGSLWSYRNYDVGGIVTIESIDLTFSISELYDGTGV